MPEGFHAKDGWFFKRLENGSVRITKDDVTVELDPWSWASVVASVSEGGESSE